MATSYFQIWLISQVIDYGCLIFILFFNQFANSRFELVTRLVVTAISSSSAWFFRERLHFYFLRDVLPKEKKNSTLNQSVWYILQTAVSSQVSFFLLGRLGCYNRDMNLIFTIQGWKQSFFDFYIMMILRDIFLLWPFHGAMHGKWYFLHKVIQFHIRIQ